MVNPTVIKFEGGSKRLYLKNLHESLIALNDKLADENIASQKSLRFFQAFSNLIGVYLFDCDIGRHPYISVSNQSGLPFYSGILDVNFDRGRNEKDDAAESGGTDEKHAEPEDPSKDSAKPDRDIIADFKDAIYSGSRKRLRVIEDEFGKSFYYQRLLDTNKFEVKTDVEEIEHYFEGVSKHVIDCNSYPLSQSAPISVSIELFKAKNFIGSLKKNILADQIRRIVSSSPEVIYNVLNQNDDIYVGIIRKLQPSFFFHEKDIEDEKIADLIGRNRNASILRLDISTLENLDIILSQNISELKAAEKDDYQENNESIYVCRKQIRKDLEGMLSTEGSSRSVIVSI